MLDHGQPARTIQIWDDPASKIAFLETVMHGKSWKADIHFPALDAERAKRMVEIREQLLKKGYEVEQIADQDGHQILRIKHDHDPQDLAHLFKNYGLVTGTAHVIQKPLVAAKDIVLDAQRRISQGVNYIMDPARANGLIFLTSEAFITASSLGAKEGKWYDPKNLLLSVAGSLFLSQSATYLFLAKKGNERILDDFNARLESARHQMGNTLLPELAKAPAVNEQKSSGFINKISDFFNAYPIQIGAMANNLGMVAFLGAFFLERRFQQSYLTKLGPEAIAEAKALLAAGFEGVADSKAAVKHAGNIVAGAVGATPEVKAQAHKFVEAAKVPFAENYINKGYYLDSAGALTSILAWTFMLLPPKETKEKSSNPLVRFWEGIREDPQKVTSAIALGSSSLRLLGSRERENPLQTIGEAVYIPGDLMLWFTKNNEYGHSTGGDNSTLLKVAAHTLNHMPVVMSAEREQAFLHEVGLYLAKQSYALSHQGKALGSGELQTKAAEIEAAMKPHLKHESVKKFDLMVGIANRLVHQFEPARRSEVADALANAISNLKGVEAAPDTIRPRLAGSAQSQLSVKEPVSIQHISQEISDLVFTIPGPHAADNASALYDALAPLLAPCRAPKQHLDEVMTATAAASLGLEKNAEEHAKPETVIAAHALKHEPMQSGSPQRHA